MDVEWVPVNYRQWLHCASRQWVDGATVKTCNFDKQIIGGSVMFSQRRNMATVSFANRVYVLGGRMRGHSEMKRRQCNKGIQGKSCTKDEDCITPPCKWSRSKIRISNLLGCAAAAALDTILFNVPSRNVL